jgi:glycosyltransferase involved in cell wall biosynthesis
MFTPGKKSEFIFSVGRLWDAAKNIETVKKCACSLAWPVCVAGEEKHPEGGEVDISSISRLGYLPPHKLASWFAIASIYAHPARYEPFGLTVLEAAMSKCALVLGDIPSLRELWQDAAVFVPPEDSEALIRELRAFCNDRAYREEMAEKAFIRSRSYTTQRMAKEYMAAYDSLVPGMGKYC